VDATEVDAGSVAGSLEVFQAVSRMIKRLKCWSLLRSKGVVLVIANDCYGGSGNGRVWVLLECAERRMMGGLESDWRQRGAERRRRPSCGWPCVCFARPHASRWGLCQVKSKGAQRSSHIIIATPFDLSAAEGHAAHETPVRAIRQSPHACPRSFGGLYAVALKCCWGWEHVTSLEKKALSPPTTAALPGSDPAVRSTGMSRTAQEG
jgi:hypothetical protein